MIGEWTGNVRSTPTPKLTLRTVKVSRAPLPWRRTTTPWNSWTRSRLPSTTRTWTFRVSPGPKSGTSSRSATRSTRSVRFMARRSSGREKGAADDASGCRAQELAAVEAVLLGELGEERPLDIGELAAAEEVGPSRQRSPQRLRGAPAGDAAVVSAREHGGDRPPAELRRARVLRVLEQPVRERLLPRGRLVAERARQQARDRL